MLFGHRIIIIIIITELLGSACYKIVRPRAPYNLSTDQSIPKTSILVTGCIML